RWTTARTGPAYRCEDGGRGTGHRTRERGTQLDRRGTAEPERAGDDSGPVTGVRRPVGRPRAAAGGREPRPVLDRDPRAARRHQRGGRAAGAVAVAAGGRAGHG